MAQYWYKRLHVLDKEVVRVRIHNRGGLSYPSGRLHNSLYSSYFPFSSVGVILLTSTIFCFTWWICIIINIFSLLIFVWNRTPLTQHYQLLCKVHGDAVRDIELMMKIKLASSAHILRAHDFYPYYTFHNLPWTKTSLPCRVRLTRTTRSHLRTCRWTRRERTSGGRQRDRRSRSWRRPG